jgi:hypothetical protein
MNNITANLIDFFKLPIKIICALAIASGIILFLPDNIATKLYVQKFRSDYGFTIGIVFIITISIILVTLCIIAQRFVIKKYKNKIFHKNSNKKLNGLSQYQKSIIYGLLLETNHTFELPLNDGAVRSLEAYIMISKAASQYPVENMYNPVYPYMLQPWVVERMNDNEKMKNEFRLAYEIMDEE